MKFLLGKKLNMTRVFQEDGRAVPVTAISAGPCFVTDIKTKDRDGYTAIQVGFGEAKRVNKPLSGHLKGKNLRHIREFRVDDVTGVEAGNKIDVSTFAVGDSVKVVGKSKGRGFQGVVKRHGFGGSPASHGHKDQLRMPGSIGATDAARVFKGKRMGGHLGDAQTTVANLEVIEIDETNNIIFLKGAIPGARGSFVMLKADGELTFASTSAEATEDKSENNEENVETQDVASEENPEEVKEEVKAEVVEEKKEEAKEEVKEEPKKEEKSEENK